MKCGLLVDTLGRITHNDFIRIAQLSAAASFVDNAHFSQLRNYSLIYRYVHVARYFYRVENINVILQLFFNPITHRRSDSQTF